MTDETNHVLMDEFKEPPLSLLSLSDVKLQIEMDCQEYVKKLTTDGDSREWIKKYVGVELGIEHKEASNLIPTIYYGFNDVKMATERIKDPNGRNHMVKDLVEKLRRATVNLLEVEALLVDVLNKNDYFDPK